MNYREKLYSTYVSIHTSHLYGKVTLDDIKKQFPVWRRYYGRFLPNDINARILDMGCGNGGFVYWLQQKGFINVLGIDISPEQVEEAKKFCINNIECVDLIHFLKGREGYYDVIFARDAIEHFTKDEILAVLQLIYDSLKEGGGVVIQTTNSEGPFGSRIRYGDFTHEIAFTRSSLNHIFKAVGFSNVFFYSTGPVSYGVKSAMRSLFWKVIEAMIRFYMLVETGSGKGIYTQNIIVYGGK